MAVQKFYDAYVYLAGTGTPPTAGGTQLPHVHSITINRSADMLDISEMGVTTKINLAGLAEWSLDVECLNDFAGTSQVDSILGTIYANQATGGSPSINVYVKPASSAVGSGNPCFYGSAVLESYNPIDGGVGDAIMVKAAFKCAGNLNRATS
jgi:hypothetical protein